MENGFEEAQTAFESSLPISIVHKHRRNKKTDNFSVIYLRRKIKKEQIEVHLGFRITID